MESEIDAIRQAYAALNRGDIEGFVKDFNDEIERTEFEGTPHGGTFRGIEAVKEHVKAGRSTWAEGTCEPERFVTVDDKIVVACHVRARLNGQTDWLEGRTGDVFTFRDGKVIEFRTFGDPDEAIAWAGVEKYESSN